MNEKQYVLHCDEISWGMYEFPLHMCDVSPNPHRPRKPSDWCGIRFAREENDSLRIDGSIVRLHPDKDGRASPAGIPVHSWCRISETAAPVVLFDALPGYWLNRFRYVGPASGFRTDPPSLFEMASFHDRRMPHRERLVNHSASLKQKTWALRYHRGNLLSIIESIKRSPIDHHAIIVGGAEYAALSHCLYSVLEELAAVLSLLRVIQGLPETPYSFHRLYQKPPENTEYLRTLSAEATWYESFRVERANSAHAFGTLFGLASGTTDLNLFQHPDPRIYSGMQGVPASARKAEVHINDLLTRSDLLITGMCAHMLTLFHPWDIVKLYNAEPGESTEVQGTTVWVKEISFTREVPHSPQAWILLDTDGVVRVRTDERGGIMKPEALKVTE